MNLHQRSFALVLCIVCVVVGRAQEAWQAALGRMPLATPVTVLDRTNCVPVMLHAFRSNAVVKALIFMPGATDELYFFKRAQAELTNADPSLLDAVTALTNQTFIQADFRPPLLVLHTTEDHLDEVATVKNRSTTAKLQQRVIRGDVLLIDADWDKTRSVAGKQLHVGLRPRDGDPVSWHFYRHSFVASGVTEWELLETLALAGKTTFTVNWWTVDFVPDRRLGSPPRLDQFPR